MSKIKVAELFYSLQGEGQYLGTPSVFLRVFGCNFECPGFGMPRGEVSQERQAIDPDQYTSYNSLPLVHTGCDSYASWDVRFKKLSPMMSIDQIVDKIQELLPDGTFGPDKHLILTGGEPLLGWQKAYIDLFKEIEARDMNLTNVTFETNGTQHLNSTMTEYLNNETDILVTMSISSKLPSSGEKWEDAIKPDIVDEYFYQMYNIEGYFKWVLSDEQDYNDVVKAIEEYKSVGVKLPVYLMSAGGTSDVYEKTHRMVAEMAMKNGWRYSPRLQVELWRNAWGT